MTEMVGMRGDGELGHSKVTESGFDSTPNHTCTAGAQQPHFDVQMAFERWFVHTDSKIRPHGTSIDLASNSYHL